MGGGGGGGGVGSLSYNTLLRQGEEGGGERYQLSASLKFHEGIIRQMFTNKPLHCTLQPG